MFSREMLEIIPEMHGYKSNMETTTAQLEMGEHVLEELHRGDLVSVCFLDISGGFDTVCGNCGIYLFKKLKTFGYDDSALEWVDSYPSNRTQVAQVQASYSEFWEAKLGQRYGMDWASGKGSRKV